jgi:hypothetical protein
MIYQNSVKIISEIPPIYLVSEHRHDFRAHYFSPTEYIAVDGNRDYLRRVGDFKYEGTKWVEWSLDSESSIKELREKLLWKTRGVDGKGESRHVLLCECETSHLKAILATQPQIIETIYEKVIKSILKTRKTK